jgi:hypothetical protein
VTRDPLRKMDAYFGSSSRMPSGVKGLWTRGISRETWEGGVGGVEGWKSAGADCVCVNLSRISLHNDII